MTLSIACANSEETERLGERLGARLKGGETIDLISDLGGGKTTFTRGIVRGSGSNDRVSSPTFTISKIYKTPKFEIHHFDFYRLHDAGHIKHELAEVINRPDTAVIIEWGDVIAGVLPKERLSVKLKTESEEARRLTFNCPEQLEYLIKDLQ